MKKTIVILLVVALGLLASVPIEIQTAKAQFTPEGQAFIWVSPLSITSPSNMTYDSGGLSLNVCAKSLLGSSNENVTMVYSIDGGANVSIPIETTFVPVTAEDTYPNGTTVNATSSIWSFYTLNGTAALPDLANGSHFLTVYAEYQVSTSNNNVGLDNKTVDFTVNGTQATPNTTTDSKVAASTNYSPNSNPTPTPSAPEMLSAPQTAPEFSWLAILPLLVFTLFFAMALRRRKRANLEVIAIMLLLIGILLIPLNFFYPVTTLDYHYQLVTTIQDSSGFNLTMPDPHVWYPLQFINSSYYYFSPVNLTSGQELEMNWYSDIDEAGYIFSQQQFAHFQEVFPSAANRNYTNTAISWTNESNKYGIAFEAATIGRRDYGGAAYNVTKSGQYIGVITNVIWPNPTSVSISHINEIIVSPFNVTQYVHQKTNLYFYVGTVFLVIGATGMLLNIRHRKMIK